MTSVAIGREKTPSQLLSPVPLHLHLASRGMVGSRVDDMGYYIHNCFLVKRRGGSMVLAHI